MSRIAQKFRRLEVTRAIKAAVAANVKVSGVEIKPDGTLALVFGPPGEHKVVNEWDAVYSDGTAPAAIRK